MANIDRKVSRKKNKRNTDLTRKQDKMIRRSLTNLRLKKGELADSTKKLFDLIALFEITLDQDQVDHFVKSEKFIVVSLDDPAPDSEIKLREGIIYFPVFGLQAVCMVSTHGARTTIYLLGNDSNKYLAVNTFLNFFNVEEQLKITGYYVALELAAYFNSLKANSTETPSIALNELIGDINDVPEEVQAQE